MKETKESTCKSGKIGKHRKTDRQERNTEVVWEESKSYPSCHQKANSILQYIVIEKKTRVSDFRNWLLVAVGDQMAGVESNY